MRFFVLGLSLVVASGAAAPAEEPLGAEWSARLDAAFAVEGCPEIVRLLEAGREAGAPRAFVESGFLAQSGRCGPPTAGEAYFDAAALGTARLDPDERAETLKAALKERAMPEAIRRRLDQFQKLERGGAHAFHRAARLLLAVGTAFPPQRDAVEFWLKRAAGAGLRDAYYELSQWYAKGPEDRRNDGLAVSHLRLASKKRHTAAQRELGERYLVGKGVPAKPLNAYLWLYSAGRNGADVADRLTDLERRLPKTAIRVARRWADERRLIGR